DLFLELLVFALLARRKRAGRVQLVVDVLLLQAAQPLELIGDGVESLEHLWLELGLDRGERHRIFEIVLVEIGLRNLSLFAAFLAVARRRGGLKRRRRGRRRRRRNRLQRGWRGAIAARHAGFADANRRGGLFGVGTGIGCFEIDDVAEE